MDPLSPEMKQALDHDARVPRDQKLGPSPCPVITRDDLIAAAQEAEVAVRVATEIITWAVQRLVNTDNTPLAAVFDARNAELKRAALTLGLITSDARASL